MQIAAACQEEKLFLQCSNRYNKLEILDTFYGRENNKICTSKVLETSKLCENQTPNSVVRKVHLMCAGENRCKIPVTSEFLEKDGNNTVCPDIRKYLKVKYLCHQNPKIRMECPGKCGDKCWPVCDQKCCNPSHLIKNPTTCPGTCSNNCAPSCNSSCCTTSQPKEHNMHILQPRPFPQYAAYETPRTCTGNCKSMCAPACLLQCCRANPIQPLMQQQASTHIISTTYLVPPQSPPPPPVAPPPLIQPMQQPRIVYQPSLQQSIQQPAPSFGGNCGGACHASCAPQCTTACCQSFAISQSQIMQPPVQPPVQINSYFQQRPPPPPINYPPISMPQAPIIYQQPCQKSCLRTCTSSCAPRCCISGEMAANDALKIKQLQERKMYLQFLTDYRKKQLQRYYQG